MGNTFFFSWEVALIEFLQSHMNEFTIKLCGLFSALGEQIFMVFILGFLYWAWDKKKGLKVGMNIMLANLIFPLIKNVFLRRRPYMDHNNIKCFRAVDSESDMMDITAQGYSFPSGHSANSVASFGSIAYYFRNNILTVLAFVIPFLVGVSRFCLGVHYPTDVLCGWIIGVIIIIVMPLLEKKFDNPMKLYWIIFAVSCLGVFYVRTNDLYSSLGITLGLLLGNMFESKYVNFKNTRKPITIILRVLGGAVVFLALNTLLKLPFSTEFLNQTSMLQFIVRFLRYAIILFVEVGIYPMLFGKVIKEK